MKLKVVYTLAVVLMLIRVDYWWWHEQLPLSFFGWMNAAMVYQIGIWLVGWLLVIYVARFVWKED